MNVMLEVDDVHRRFGGVSAVDGVSFSISKGERVAIIGPNGAGKSTLLNCLMGQPAPTSGRIVFDGVEVTKRAAHVRARLGIAKSFQSVSLLLDLTVLENAILAAIGQSSIRYSIARSARRDRLTHAAALELVGHAALLDKSGVRVSDLSYGEQRRLDLAVTLAGHPKLYLFDEPSAGLTSQESQDVVEIINRLDRDATVLVIDHDMDVVFGIAERVIVMHRGRILVDGTAAAVRDDPRVREVYFGDGTPDA